jgi:hypothetical protein
MLNNLSAALKAFTNQHELHDANRETRDITITKNKRVKLLDTINDASHDHILTDVKYTDTSGNRTYKSAIDAVETANPMRVELMFENSQDCEDAKAIRSDLSFNE